MTDQPALFSIEGKPVHRGDTLYHPIGAVKAEFPANGAGEVTVRTENGAVPTVKLRDLRWAPREDDLLRRQFEKECAAMDIRRTTERDFKMWLRGRHSVTRLLNQETQPSPDGSGPAPSEAMSELLAELGVAERQRAAMSIKTMCNDALTPNMKGRQAESKVNDTIQFYHDVIAPRKT